jgi:hypothetical protein
MNIIEKIGAFEIPILQVSIIRKRETWIAQLLAKCGVTLYGRWERTFAGYDVTLDSGAKFRLTEIEKQQLDKARELHAMTLQVYGMAMGAGLRT